jgi:hypothetical protein
MAYNKNKKTRLSNQVKIKGELTIFQESLYLLISSRKRCGSLLRKKELNERDIIDTYISLHLILEISLNTLHRQIITSKITIPINELNVIENIDRIGFAEKTALFVYNSSFDFGNDIQESTNHHEIVGKLRDFSEVRNKLIHGYSIASLTTSTGLNQSTKTRKLLNLTKLKKQIKLFIDINEGMKFFLDHLNIENWSREYVKDLKGQYLNCDFIPKPFLNENQQ